MKVLFVIDTLEESGAERSLVEITTRFKKIEPVFVHIYSGDYLKGELVQKGIKVYSLNIDGEWNFKKAEEKLEVIYQKERPEIVHSTLLRSDFIARRLKKRYPNVFLINSFVNNSYHPKRFEQFSLGRKLKLRLIQYLDRRSSKKVDFFISNSETIKVAKAKDLHISLGKIRVIYRGRDIEFFEENKEREKIAGIKRKMGLEKKKILLNVGRLIESKGQKDLIRAMPAVLEQNPDTVLLIAGDGPFRKELEEMIEQLQLCDSIYLLGRRNDVPDLLEISDFFVFPSYLEGLPGALIEAMLKERIIICSDIPVNLECIDKNSAIIFEVGNHKEISNKINYSLANIENLSGLARKAREEAIRKFDIEDISRSYEDFYLSVNLGQ